MSHSKTRIILNNSELYFVYEPLAGYTSYHALSEMCDLQVPKLIRFITEIALDTIFFYIFNQGTFSAGTRVYPRPNLKEKYISNSKNTTATSDVIAQQEHDEALGTAH